MSVCLRDLQIGDIVKTKRGKVVRVMDLEENGWYSPYSSDDRYEPIEITPEILEQIGFEKFTEKYNFTYDYTYWEFKKFGDKVHIEEGGHSKEYGFLIKITQAPSEVLHRIYYVNELQHLARMFGLMDLLNNIDKLVPKRNEVMDYVRKHKDSEDSENDSDEIKLQLQWRHDEDLIPILADLSRGHYGIYSDCLLELSTGQFKTGRICQHNTKYWELDGRNNLFPRGGVIRWMPIPPPPPGEGRAYESIDKEFKYF